MTMGEPALRLTGISKRFGALLANDDISLELGRGEVLALLGENGAGKSTLVSILFGDYRPDTGSVEVFGRKLEPGDPAAALAVGIGMVHQHFTLADNLDVLDNVLIGTEPWWRPMSRRAAARARLLELSERFGLQVDPSARVGDLSIGEKQRVEILKALYRDTRILILDEPTAVLAPQESVQLFATLRAFVEAGLSIIFISHKLGEVLAVSDRIAVLRQGRLEAVLPTHQADAATLSMLMVGRSIERPVRPAPMQPVAGQVVVPALSVDRVDVREGARQRLRSVSLVVNPGEIVAIAGIAGNGQQALAELVCGLRSPDAGTVRVEGKELGADPIDWIRAGVGRIPEDRQHLGVIAAASIAENAVAEHYREPPYARGGWRVDHRAIDQAATRIVADYDVRCRDIGQATSQLSGGNIQKLLLGRVLSRHPRLIIADQPTWGLDVGAIAWIHARLMSAAAQGAAVLLISEELDEIFALADRVSVISQGQLSPALPVAQWTIQSLGLAMTGSLTHEQAGRFRVALCAHRDPHAGDAADAHRHGDRGRLQGPLFQHRRRGAALSGRPCGGRSRRPARRQRLRSACAPSCRADDPCRHGGRRRAGARAGAAESASGRR